MSGISDIIKQAELLKLNNFRPYIVSVTTKVYSSLLAMNIMTEYRAGKYNKKNIEEFDKMADVYAQDRASVNKIKLQYFLKENK